MQQIFTPTCSSFEERCARIQIVNERPIVKCLKCARVIPQLDDFRVYWRTGRFENDLSLLPDFFWPSGLGVLIVRDDVVTRLATILPDAKFRKLDFVPDGELPRGIRQVRSPPVVGLPLWHLTSENVVHLNLARSQRVATNPCSTCGRADWQVSDGARIHLSAQALGEATLFRIPEFGVPYFVPDAIAMELERHKFTNLRLKGNGVVFDGSESGA